MENIFKFFGLFRMKMQICVRQDDLEKRHLLGRQRGGQCLRHRQRQNALSSRLEQILLSNSNNRKER